jgi:PAS domain S-box-containing protein
MKRRLGRAACPQTEVQYRDFCEQTDILIQHVTPDGRFGYVNPAWRHTLGYSDDEVGGLSIFRLLHPQCRPAHLELFRQVLRGERGRERVETLLLARDGTAISVEGSLTCQFVEGQPAGMLGFFQDVSARKGQEQQRADALAMLLHDLRNPMSAILGYTQLLYEQTRGEGLSHITETLRRIEANALTLCSLVGNSLGLAAGETGRQGLKKTPVAINDLLRQIVRQYEVGALARGLSLQARLQEGLPLIAGDAVELERVFTNLLHNALKFTPACGRVLVRSERRGQDVAVHISDTGPGVAPAELSSIFEKYWQGEAHWHRGGVGLGLFIVKTVVEAHGGHVEVENNPGGGACFSVFLPIPSSVCQAITAPSPAEERAFALSSPGA